MADDSIRRIEGPADAGSGRALFRRAWIPEAPQRVVVLVHGYAEHSGRYEHVGAWLAERGAAVHAYDHQGHGRSDGVRGHVARFDDFLDDLERVIGFARAEHPRLPVFVFGHSMGSLIALSWATRRRTDVAGVASSGAALHIAEVPSLLQRIALRVSRVVAPRSKMDRPIADEALSRDPSVGERYRADPLIFQHMTVSLAAALFDAARETVEAASNVTVPLLMLHGGDDPITPPTGSEAFFAGLTADGSDLRVYPGLRHEILNEPEWETVIADLQAWLEKRQPDPVHPPAQAG